jgi:hypothetical protein
MKLRIPFWRSPVYNLETCSMQKYWRSLWIIVERDRSVPCWLVRARIGIQ